MRLYLDTADLINLLERESAGIKREDFRALLLKGRHSIVLSFQTICELMAPLWEPNSTTIVTSTMNKLEELPHEWIDLVRLPNLEVGEALQAFKQGRKYNPVSPNVPNYLATIINAPDLLKLALQYPLSEAVFDLWRSGTFDPRTQHQRHVHTYRSLMDEDRKLVATLGDKSKARKQLFATRVVERIKYFKLYAPEDENNETLFTKCSEEITQEKEWCPGTKIVFSTFHSLMDNLGDKLQDGDLGDLSHTHALPYVDWFTTDRRIAGHISAASKLLGTNHHEKLVRNIRELVKRLS